MSGFMLKLDRNNRAVAEILIRKKDDSGYIPVQFKFDPGADITTISLKDLEDLGYGDIKDVRSLAYSFGSGSVATDGITNHYAIDLNLMNIFGVIMPKGLKFPFTCLSIRNVPRPKIGCPGCDLIGEQKSGFRSLLGNDILSCFDVEIKRSAKQIILKKVSDLSERNRVYSHCQVHDLESQKGNTRSSVFSDKKK